MTHIPPFWSRIVTLAGVFGLLPFVLAFIVTINPNLLPIDKAIFESAIIGFGVLILSFLGGVRWGIRLQGGAGSDLIFIVGMLGSAVGFFILLMPHDFGLIVLTIGFALQGAWDIWSSGVPQFYARLRASMTGLVCLILIAILIARIFI
ncbi:MAG: DUF3429 domain-containing protein [Devosiaceae bacterium]|nr:DUF3429 domain-containing protein [Devosiaceae bacterium]